MKKEKLTALLFFVIGTELIGGLSGLLAGGNFSEFYKSLQQPIFAPPSWLFPVMWSILYVLMGISAYQIYESNHLEKIKALTIYGIQLAVNFLWSIVFFKFKSLAGAVIVILALLILIIWMMLLFSKIKKSAVYLNIPYLLWTGFASYLTIGIYLLNR